MLNTAIDFMERGLAPDPLIRIGIRRLLAQRLHEHPPDPATLRAELDASPIAPHSDKANEQHYELPAGFFELIMGRHLKYSAGYWPDGVTTLDQAEAAILALFRETYGADQAERWFRRWRVFFMACAELFGYRGGEEWGVSPYRFARQGPARTMLRPTGGGPA